MKAGSIPTPRTQSHRSGYSLIELLMSMAILVILVGSIPAVLAPAFQQIKVERTRLQLLRIRHALVGDSSKVSHGFRTDFGYLGDLGAVPDRTQGLQALLAHPVGTVLYDADPAVRFGRGWKGPYLDTGEAGIDWTKDAWGTALEYEPRTSPMTVTSYGSNKVAGGTGTDTDIVVEIPDSVIKFTLYGFVVDSSGNPYTGPAEVQLNDLDGVGGVSNPGLVAPGQGGYFSFGDVTLGRRSVTVYVPDFSSATTVVGPVTVTPGSNHVQIPADALKLP
jgi:prepilin-type N-terminal cleavage/methylation domain-containing protein